MQFTLKYQINILLLSLVGPLIWNKTLFFTIRFSLVVSSTHSHFHSQFYLLFYSLLSIFGPLFNLPHNFNFLNNDNNTFYINYNLIINSTTAIHVKFLSHIIDLVYFEKIIAHFNKCLF